MNTLLLGLKQSLVAMTTVQLLKEMILRAAGPPQGLEVEGTTAQEGDQTEGHSALAPPQM